MEETAMTTGTGYPHITKESGAPARLENHSRTRVSLIVADYLARGLGPEDLVRHYPYLTLAEVHAAMTYYHDHREEIDAEIQAELDQCDHDADANRRSPVWQKLQARGKV
jgi:uncharacterized protein (DUF433 family)